MPMRHFTPRRPASVSGALLLLLFWLGGCAQQPATPADAGGARQCQAPPVAGAPCAPCPVCPPASATVPVAPAAPPLRAATWDDLPGWREDKPGEARAAFLASCTVLDKQAVWRPLCAELKSQSAQDGALREFFESRLRPWQVVNADTSSQGLVTGYYEPLLRGSRTRSKTFPHALYGVPDDLLVVDLGELHPELKNLRLRGRLDGRRIVPYWSRAQLTPQSAALAGKALFWVADPIELFFLQVQGSGRIELPDGRRVRVGYADQNGYPYQSIGRWLVEQGELKLEDASMQGIQTWARTHPQRLTELLNVNPSFVFFRELPDSGAQADPLAGPLGALGVPLTPGRSIAVDPRVIPLGAPVFLATTQPASARPLRRLVFAQDTGGAIKGAVRADFFWGFGAEAGKQAGRMRQTGALWVLLPLAVTPDGLAK